MREIGGYIELDNYHLPMLHADGIALNCGRNALAYLFKSKGISKMKIPYFICDSVIGVCNREGVKISYYHIGMDFMPHVDLEINEDEWLYLVNFYGQLSNEEIIAYVSKYKRVIVDQAQAYFEEPLPGIDTLYTCRKWFGVADGAFLYTDIPIDGDLPQDESYDRMRFLLGRYERTANEFYAEYIENNGFFTTEPIKKMSKLTKNLLHGINYEAVKQSRMENFNYLHENLAFLNKLEMIQTGNFMYPFMIENGYMIRKKLQQEKIYIPMLWPSVLKMMCRNSLEYNMAENILPLPIDQRYGLEDMEYMIKKIKELLEVVK